MSNTDKFKRLLTKVILFHGKLDTCQKLYLNLIIIVLAFLIGFLFFEPQQRKACFVMILIYWSAVVAFEAVRIYKKVFSFTLGKAFILLGFTLCTNMALSIAGVVVNDITTVSPSNFPHVLILISIAIIPLMTAVTMLFIYIAIFMTVPIWGSLVFVYDNNLKKLLFPGYEPQDGYFLCKTTRLVQALSTAAYCLFIYVFFHNILDDYSKFIYSNSQSFIYNFEMYSKSPCIGLPPGKIAFINDDHVLHASKDGEIITFSTYSCEYKKGK